MELAGELMSACTATYPACRDMRDHLSKASEAESDRIKNVYEMAVALSKKGIQAANDPPGASESLDALSSRTDGFHADCDKVQATCVDEARGVRVSVVGAASRFGVA
jgi:hypothetical protein